MVALSKMYDSNATAPSRTTKDNGQDPPSCFDEGSIVETDLMIIGAGPAGASLACFLAQHGRT
jgi:NADPH-dependent glutamate synthase beta subunit-like oxidoreductase